MKILGIFLTIVIQFLLFTPFFVTVTTYKIPPTFLSITLFLQVFIVVIMASVYFYRWFLNNLK